MRTYSPKPDDIQRRWHVIDAADVVLGRLASHTATLLRGKHKPIFAPNVDTGDFVIIINAEKVALTGNKREDKMVYRHSGYPGGLKATPIGVLLSTRPERVIETAVKGMLPKNTLGRAMIKKLKVYAGPSHPHAAQQPQPFQITQIAQEGVSVTATTDQTPVSADGATTTSEATTNKIVRDFESVQTVGRRKTAIVRVRVTPGTGKFTLDKKGVRSLENVFDKVQCQLIQQPFDLTGTKDTFDVRATLSGGGTSGQAGAMVLAIARALTKINQEWRSTLKKAGLLTRDARAKERKKAGLKKARKAPQYSKR